MRGPQPGAASTSHDLPTSTGFVTIPTCRFPSVAYALWMTARVDRVDRVDWRARVARGSADKLVQERGEKLADTCPIVFLSMDHSPATRRFLLKDEITPSPMWHIMAFATG